MRSLYTVFIVDPDADEIVFEHTVIAKDERDAERKGISLAGDKLQKVLNEFEYVIELRGSGQGIGS